MTLIAIWYRREQRDIYAIADSRLTAVNGGVLSDQVPKFAVLSVKCFAPGRKNHFDKLVLDRTIAVGYAGSSSVAFATIATLQSYLTTFAMRAGGATPNLRQVGELAKQILDGNFRAFGALWENNASCELVIFGYLPSDQEPKIYHLSARVTDGRIDTILTELPNNDGAPFYAFGSGSGYFVEQLRADMEATKNFHPFNLLNRMIDRAERDDIGGYIQVAIADSSRAYLPHVSNMRSDRGEFDADVTFLGRDVSEIGQLAIVSLASIRSALTPRRCKKCAQTRAISYRERQRATEPRPFCATKRATDGDLGY